MSVNLEGIPSPLYWRRFILYVHCLGIDEVHVNLQVETDDNHFQIAAFTGIPFEASEAAEAMTNFCRSFDIQAILVAVSIADAL